jgi:putative DNA primase/helicase
MTNILELATGYAKRGWSVLPVHGISSDNNCTCRKPSCEHPGKHPRTLHGYKDATIDEAAICRFCQFESTNIGIATGSVSGICVIDIDSKNGGVESLHELESKYGPLPKTMTVLTGTTNSEHRYFKYPTAGMRGQIGLI